MRASSLPDQVTINWLAECVGMHPSTVKRRTTGLQRDTTGKLNRVQALEFHWLFRNNRWKPAFCVAAQLGAHFQFRLNRSVKP